MKKSIKYSIFTYILFLLSMFSLYKSGVFEVYKIYFILGLVLIIIKDTLIYGFEIKPTTQTKYDTQKIFSPQNGLYYKVLFINRHYIFPFFLIFYIISLLIQQIHIFGLHNFLLFKTLNQDMLLGITIFSGIFTVLKESRDNSYQIEYKSSNSAAGNIVLTIILSILGTYIIFIQTQSLGVLMYPISLISGILIFLVGISILDEDEQEINLNETL